MSPTASIAVAVGLTLVASFAVGYTAARLGARAARDRATLDGIGDHAERHLHDSQDTEQ